jgi:hypothetical protein
VPPQQPATCSERECTYAYTEPERQLAPGTSRHKQRKGKQDQRPAPQRPGACKNSRPSRAPPAAATRGYRARGRVGQNSQLPERRKLRFNLASTSTAAHLLQLAATAPGSIRRWPGYDATATTYHIHVQNTTPAKTTKRQAKAYPPIPTSPRFFSGALT